MRERLEELIRAWKAQNAAGRQFEEIQKLVLPQVTGMGPVVVKADGESYLVSVRGFPGSGFMSVERVQDLRED